MILCSEKCKYQQDGYCCYDTTIVNKVYNPEYYKNENLCTQYNKV